MGIVQDLPGHRFHKLTVVSLAFMSERGAHWICKCDCGNECTVTTEKLRHRKRNSCGCDKAKTHGHTIGGSSPTHMSWKSMIARCSQPSNPAYPYYKKLGIEVCERWRTFENFLADMGERPSLQHSIDRHPNQTGDYEPGNCRWATKREQANNRITNKMFSYKGEEITFAELARRTGLSKEMLRHRLLRAGWSLEDAINAPRSQGSRAYHQ
jgi:hypothetical protein